MAALRFIPNLRAVRARREHLFMLAIAGSTGAMDALRILAMHACVFACLSVHNTIQNQENNYERWLHGLPMFGLANHKNAAANAGAWVAGGLTLEHFADARGDAFADAALSVRGLGYAKATFAAGLLAFSHQPCIDTHMARMIGIKPSFSSMRAYRAAVLASPYRTTLQQWRAFMAVPAFARSQHDIYFASVLAPALMLPAASDTPALAIASANARQLAGELAAASR